MDNMLSSDRPIHIRSDDKFQRYNFSKRIAQTISTRNSSECIVIGLYGAWGEGKTSVLNFIEEELSPIQNVITVKFNPWRYQDENILLSQFFNVMSTALDANLKSKKEKIGELFVNYSKLVNIPVIGDYSGAVEAAGKAMAITDVEILKDRISKIITKSNKKIIVFIDDIDRLDKSEIHAIFRLVKLTADFSNTTYILSFDEQMVSAAIGERFGEGNKEAGKQFLEKIIQVPLQIPLAQPAALQKFLIDMLNIILDANHIDINGNESNRFHDGFRNLILLKLDTPRLAVRYANAISFSIPLLLDEVNIVDLLLIEAIKVFYPSFYNFIKENPEYFIDSYQSVYDSGNLDKTRSEKIIKHIERLCIGLNDKQVKGINDTLILLFPVLKEALSHTNYSDHKQTMWYKEKRIVSPHYFNRYFSYTVIEGDISDTALNILFKTLPSKSTTDQENAIKEFLNDRTVENFLRKLRMNEENLDWNIAVILAKNITKNADTLKDDGYGDFFASMGVFSQSAMFITKTIEYHKNKTEGYDLFKELLSKYASIDYSFELIRWSKAGNRDENVIFDETQFQHLSELILKSAIKQSKNESLYDKFPDDVYRLFGIWHKKNAVEFRSYIEARIENDAKAYLKILYALTSKIRSSSNPAPYYANIDLEQYNYITNLIDKELIKTKILANFNENELNGKIIWDSYNGPYQTDLNLVSQFMHQYNTSLKVDELKGTQPS